MTQSIESCLTSKSTSFHEIPIVDIAPLLDGSNVSLVARQIGDICEKVGFLYIKNHGVPSSLVKDVYRLSREFFAQPFDVKDQLNIVKSGPTLRGYIPMYGENVDPKNTKDFKECFDFAQSEQKVSPFFGPNLMPESPKNSR
ncbi:2-oxoglutarate and iron-dependent oxygenase domain-containing protein [Pseudomonas sp. Ap32]|nr:2-oxoglutarate and iron-dependent oxygenase domain-containing protein [Pseudomonas sp. Ap32]